MFRRCNQVRTDYKTRQGKKRYDDAAYQTQAGITKGCKTVW